MSTRIHYIDPADERQFVLDGNNYAGRNDALLARWGGRDYRMADFARYREESGETGQRTLEAVLKFPVSPKHERNRGGQGARKKPY